MHLECSSLDVFFILFSEKKDFQRKRLSNNYTFFTMTWRVEFMIQCNVIESRNDEIWEYFKKASMLHFYI